MEVRKVQVTGGATYTVSLPKDWARENGIEGGSRLAMFPRGGSLFVEKLQSETEKTEGTMEITGLEDEHLVRAVISMYVSGFDIIRFESDRITSEQRRTLRGASQGLAGLEIIEETREHVVFQELLDSSEISVHRTVSRMRLIARGMFEDAVRAVVEQDDALSRDVIERDDDADRMFAMVSRIFRSSLSDMQSQEKLGMSRKECFDYHTTARQLERIADHAEKIAEVAVELEEPLPEEMAEPLEEAADASLGIVEDAMRSFLELEGDEAIRLANDALDTVPEIEKRAKELDQTVHGFDAQRAQLLGLVIDSVLRTADYGSNISEIALQSAAPEP